jgi:hypothetical protein
MAVSERTEQLYLRDRSAGATKKANFFYNRGTTMGAPLSLGVILAVGSDPLGHSLQGQHTAGRKRVV